MLMVCGLMARLRLQKVQINSTIFFAIVDEENDFEETNYRDEWLDDNNWYIIDNENEKKGIYIPAVYPDGEISWRWR